MTFHCIAGLKITANATGHGFTGRSGKNAYAVVIPRLRKNLVKAWKKKKTRYENAYAVKVLAKERCKTEAVENGCK